MRNVHGRVSTYLVKNRCEEGELVNEKYGSEKPTRKSDLYLLKYVQQHLKYQVWKRTSGMGRREVTNGGESRQKQFRI